MKPTDHGSEHEKLPSRDEIAPDLAGIKDLTGGIHKPKENTCSLDAEESGERRPTEANRGGAHGSTAREMMPCQAAHQCWVHLAGISLLAKWPGQGSEHMKSSNCVPNSS